MFFIYFFLVVLIHLCVCGKCAISVSQSGDKYHIYDPSPFYINDHTFIYDGDQWHMIGITHSEPGSPGEEVNLAHAVSKTLTSNLLSWKQMPFALGAIYPETHLWAPHIIFFNNTYYMFYCGGGDDTLGREHYMLKLAISKDLWSWERKGGILFTDGVDGRDPMVLDLGEDYKGGGNRFLMYNTATDPDIVSESTAHHIVHVRSSSDLIKWSEPTLAFDGGPTDTTAGGPTESPFVVQRGNGFYLFSGSWVGYSTTRAFYSINSLDFGSVVLNTAVQVGEFEGFHAAEVTRDLDGKWYISHGGWGQGGLYLAPITFDDGLEENCTTNLPIPSSHTILPADFKTNLVSPWSNNTGEWVMTPSGMQGGNPFGNAFYTSHTFIAHNKALICDLDIKLTTNDGNPKGTGDYDCPGSAAAIVFHIQGDGYDNPETNGCYALNIHTEDGGGVKLMSFPYNLISNYKFPIQQEEWYHFKFSISASNDITVDFGNSSSSVETVIHLIDNTYTSGYVGLNIWRSAAMFQNVYCEIV